MWVLKTLPLPIVLTIAGSDSGGGAGIQADLKTFAAHRVYGCSAITSITAQNSLGVQAIEDCSPDTVAAQIDAVLGDLAPVAIKTGMLSNAQIVEVVCEKLREYGCDRLVVDPVMISKSGHKLLSNDACDILRRKLLPLSGVFTPNLDEAGELLGRRVDSVPKMVEAARELVDLGAKTVIIKGGHLASDSIVDVFWDGATMHKMESQRIDTGHTHGTGCTLSAAIAANLALGHGSLEAIRNARHYLEGAIANAFPVGSGIGPVHHLWEWTGDRTKTEEKHDGTTTP